MQRKISRIVLALGVDPTKFPPRSKLLAVAREGDDIVAYVDSAVDEALSRVRWFTALRAGATFDPARYRFVGAARELMIYEYKPQTKSERELQTALKDVQWLKREMLRVTGREFQDPHTTGGS